MHQIDTISSVSGGSIISAFFADRIIEAGAGESAAKYSKWLDKLDWKKKISNIFKERIKKDIRTSTVLITFGINIFTQGPRIKKLENSYRNIIIERKLTELPKVVDFIFCASDITFGVNWEFKRDQSGDYKAGYLNHPVNNKKVTIQIPPEIRHFRVDK